MVLLSDDDLRAASLDGLTRLATWLGVAPPGPWPSDGARRHALVTAIQRAEARLRKMPRERRHEARAAAR